MTDEAINTEYKTIYRVTITQTRLENTLRGREWKQGVDLATEDGYGYTPQVIEAKEVNREIYSQTIEGLDIEAVVKAVNKIGGGHG